MNAPPDTRPSAVAHVPGAPSCCPAEVTGPFTGPLPRPFTGPLTALIVGLAGLAGLVGLAGCQAPAAQGADDGPGGHAPHPHLRDHLAAVSLIGTWRWAHVVDDPGLRRLETETWQFWPVANPDAVLRGRYLREVEVSSAAEPFVCNQARRYRQRASFELEVVAHDGVLEIIETDYLAMPSPCDHGFRRLERYRAHVRRGRAALEFPQGRQTLWQIDEAVPSPPAPPWPHATAPLAGTWRWSNRARDEQGLWQTETEHWEFSGDGALTSPAELRDGATFAAIYARRVTVESPEGADLACAAAPRYGFEDRYLVEGKRRDGIIVLRETAVAAAEHPCLRGRSVRAWRWQGVSAERRRGCRPHRGCAAWTDPGVG